MKEKNKKSSEYKVGVRRKSTLHERSLNLPAKSSRINQRSQGWEIRTHKYLIGSTNNQWGRFPTDWSFHCIFYEEVVMDSCFGAVWKRKIFFSKSVQILV